MELTNLRDGSTVSFRDFLDSISDSPEDPLEFVRMSLDCHRAWLENWQQFRAQDTDDPVRQQQVETACFWLQDSVMMLEDIERRMLRRVEKL